MKVFAALAPCLAMLAIACGPALPIEAKVVSCADQSPLGDAHIMNNGVIRANTKDDGYYRTKSIGKETVAITKDGYKKKEVTLEPNTTEQVICLEPVANDDAAPQQP